MISRWYRDCFFEWLVVIFQKLPAKLNLINHITISENMTVFLDKGIGLFY